MMLLLLTAMHFCVDGVCAAVMAAYAVSEPFFEPIVFHFGLYNLIAFAGQAPTGLLLDRRPRAVPFALVFSAAALLLGMTAAPRILWQTVALGLGNCAFHAAAGRLVLCRYEGFAAPGIFVSSGAVGLGLGLNRLLGAPLFFAADVIATGLVFWLSRQGSDERTVFPAAEAERSARAGMGANAAIFGANAEIVGERLSARAVMTLPVCAFLLLACVVLRGFGGGSATALGMMLPCVMAAGKCLGGLVCDRVGYRNTLLLIFLLSFVALRGAGTAFALLLTLAFNMTMALTLRLAHWCAPTMPGLMFGLAAGCLLPGVFFAGALTIPPAAMAAVQFLALFFAGLLMRRAYPGEAVIPDEGRVRP
ncbi:MAG: hypothetical protein IJU05_03535 [Schwartzia sp.]|nr:hypothetical protein [Schwartzia sp. (in: firmicutes)]